MFRRTLTALALIGIMALSASPVLAQEEELIEDTGAVEQKIEELADKIVAAFEGVEGKEEMNRIAVVRFTNLGPTASEKQLGQIVAELMTTSLARKPQFLLVEREQIEKVLDELKLSLLGLTEADNAEKVGKLLNARAIITGSVSEVGEVYSVNARQVDVATGEVILTADVRIHQSAMLGLSYRYLVRRTRSEAMFRSFVPGWGQFYNEQPVKGFLFSGVELGLLGSAVTLYILANSAQDKSDDPNEPDRGDYYEKAKDRYLAGDILLYSALGVWVVGIVDAYLNGPDFEEVKVAGSGPASGFSKKEGLSLFAVDSKEREIRIAYNFRF
ncbi:MAG: hypothetical protein JSU92_02620 [Deltaproteobacteria bacterium]|nr:MAG: hypothetical protein JSU92_02620 [Deltaproteobacteria bacterium]